jgi:hypothetical protein
MKLCTNYFIFMVSATKCVKFFSEMKNMNVHWFLDLYDFILIFIDIKFIHQIKNKVSKQIFKNVFNHFFRVY